jgi:hypothetical protein
MINGRVKPAKAVIQALAKELDSDERYLDVKRVLGQMDGHGPSSHRVPSGSPTI